MSQWVQRLLAWNLIVSRSQSEAESSIDPLDSECTVDTKLSTQSVLNASLEDADKEERSPGKKKKAYARECPKGGQVERRLALCGHLVVSKITVTCWNLGALAQISPLFSWPTYISWDPPLGP